MGIDRDDRSERQERIERMMNEFREAERRRLVKRGIELWNRTAGAQRDSTVAAASGAVKKLD